MASPTKIFEYPNMPFLTPLTGGANDGSELILSGTLTAGPNNGFAVEYQSLEGVALHFNVRMGFIVGTERVIVVNNNQGGRWLTEERHMNNLVPNQYVNISIKTFYDKYVITVNGSYLCAFNHRESPINVHTVQVRGDIRLERVQMINFAATKPTIIVQQQPAPATVVVATPVRPQPTTVVVAAPPRPAPTVVIAAPPRPSPTIVIAPRPRAPIVEVVIPRRRGHR